ncbi:LamG domain-containing protein [[Eubacterium] cellulosolvens]
MKVESIIGKANIVRGWGRKVKKNKRTQKLVIVLVATFMALSAIPVMAAEPTVDITFNFVDQYGATITTPVATGAERVYVDGYGYYSNGQTLTVLKDEVIYYRAYFQSGSALTGPKNHHTCTDTGSLSVPFMSVTMNFVDQEENTIIPPAATTNEKVYIDHVGYKANGETLVVPMQSTVSHRAYYQAGSALQGPKMNIHTDDIENDELVVQFITFEIEFTPGLPYTGNERVYVDHVGYKGNGDLLTVPLESTVYYRMYYQAGSNVQGSKNSEFIATGNIDFDHNFKAIEVNFIEPTGIDISAPPATGNERVYIDHIGYRSNGDTIVVPDDSTLYYRAYYQAGSAVQGIKYSVNVETLLSACESPINPLAPDLLAYWRLDEDTGDTAFDSTMYNNDGTINGATRLSTGVISNALRFDGVDDYIQVPDSNNLEPMVVSVEAWVRSDNPGSFSYIIGKGGDACKAVSYGLYTGSSAGLYFYVYSGSSFVLSPNAGTGVWDNQWHHVVGTYDGTRVRLYVDGAEIGTGTPATILIQYNLPTFDHLLIGAYKGSCSFIIRANWMSSLSGVRH